MKKKQSERDIIKEYKQIYTAIAYVVTDEITLEIQNIGSHRFYIVWFYIPSGPSQWKGFAKLEYALRFIETIK